MHTVKYRSTDGKITKKRKNAIQTDWENKVHVCDKNNDGILRKRRKYSLKIQLYINVLLKSHKTKKSNLLYTNRPKGKNKERKLIKINKSNENN